MKNALRTLGSSSCLQRKPFQKLVKIDGDIQFSYYISLYISEQKYFLIISSDESLPLYLTFPPTLPLLDSEGNSLTSNAFSCSQSPQASSPTNYNEFYDEDEKALMESIEQDFVGTVYTTLPGAVM